MARNHDNANVILHGVWLKFGVDLPYIFIFWISQFGYAYHSETFHGNKAFKMPSDEYWNIDIYAEIEIEIYKKLFRNQYSDAGGGFHLLFITHFYVVNSDVL